MIKLVDKPYKTVSYIITLLLISTLILISDARIYKSMRMAEQVNVETAEISDKVTNEIVAAEITVATAEIRDKVTNEIVVASAIEEVIVPTPQKEAEVTLSRGGTPPKQLSERETINTYVKDIASKYNIQPELIMSIIESESTYNPKCKTGNCLGLMQVSSYWHADRAAKLGVKDFYDPYGNILLGVDYISELLKQYKDIKLVLMLYNMNHDTAISMYKNGQLSTYAKTVLERAEKFKKGE